MEPLLYPMGVMVGVTVLLRLTHKVFKAWRRGMRKFVIPIGVTLTAQLSTAQTPEEWTAEYTKGIWDVPVYPSTTSQPYVAAPRTSTLLWESQQQTECLVTIGWLIGISIGIQIMSIATRKVNP